MNFKDLLNVIDHRRIYVTDADYNCLAYINVEDDFNKYSSECNKAREIAESGEYTVKSIQLLDGINTKPCIAIEIEKGRK